MQFGRRMLNRWSKNKAIMTNHRLTFYRPREGADLVIKIEDGDVNVSQCIAMQLHKIWSQEQQRLNKGRQAFISNITYRFSSGLVFRLFDSGLEDGNVVTEFLALNRDGVSKKTILLTVTERLCAAGISAQSMSELAQFLNCINSERPETECEATDHV